VRYDHHVRPTRVFAFDALVHARGTKIRLRILWMVPLYALQSYLSLRYHRARIYIDTVRDFYEAYVIASFVYYLMELLGGQDALVELLRHKDPSIGQHSFPLSLILEPWELGLELLLVGL